MFTRAPPREMEGEGKIVRVYDGMPPPPRPKFHAREFATGETVR